MAITHKDFDHLSDRNVTGPIDRETILDTADSAVVVNEFIVAYETPIEPVYSDIESNHRGYLTVWVESDTARMYHREQSISGDDDMVRSWVQECATGDIVKIESLIGQ